MPQVLSVNEVAALLRTTPQSLRTLMSAGRDVPPSFSIGRRRLFLRSEVLSWLYRKAGVMDHGARADRSPSGSPSKKGNPMPELLEVSEGDVFVDHDDEEFTVTALHPESGYAVLQDSEENQSTVTIKSLLRAIESGDLMPQRDADDSDDEEE